MIFKEITITCNKENLNEFEDFCIDLGASSVTLKDAKDQPILEPKVGETPLWSDILLTALFTQETDINQVKEKIRASFPTVLSNLIQVHQYEDQDWERTCMDDFSPMQFGQHLWICPSWELPPDPDAINIILDPGLAFGTGTHPTTGLCLTWLDEIITGDENVIDYGCGSGILAVAAAKLGAKKVYAIDNDPQAILATNDNALKNTIKANILETYLDSNQPDQIKVDILIANILANILIQLAPVFADKIKPKGKIALSGILSDQYRDVLEAFGVYFQMKIENQQDDWMLLTGIRKV